MAVGGLSDLEEESYVVVNVQETDSETFFIFFTDSSHAKPSFLSSAFRYRTKGELLHELAKMGHRRLRISGLIAQVWENPG